MTSSQWIHIPTSGGDRFKGYLAIPAAGRGPGILLLQEIFGVNRSLREIADHYAEAGYVCLAPNLFWRIEPGVELGYTEAEIQKGILYLEQFDVDQSLKDIDDALGILSQREECTGKIGALGFCLGGLLVYLAAARTGIDCAVSYYGINIEKKLDEASRIRCPMVFHFGERDRYAPAEAREQIRAAFAAHTDVEFFVYPDCDHAFATLERPSFNEAATLLAHSRSIGLFRRVLGPY